MSKNMGKYWNLGGDPANFPASRRTLFALWLASGKRKDYRTATMTQGEAFAILQRINAENAQKKARGTPGQVEAAFYHAVMRKATEAANKAGSAWLAEREPSFVIYHEENDSYEEIYGSFGGVYIKFPHVRTKFGKWLKEYYFDGQYEYIPVPHNYVGRREYGLLLVCEQYALDTFERNGILGLKLIHQRND